MRSARAFNSDKMNVTYERVMYIHITISCGDRVKVTNLEQEIRNVGGN